MDIETTPPVPVSEVGRNAALVVAEMLKLRDAFADVQNKKLQVRVLIFNVHKMMISDSITHRKAEAELLLGL
jgi:hypothetical protein